MLLVLTSTDWPPLRFVRNRSPRGFGYGRQSLLESSLYEVCIGDTQSIFNTHSLLRPMCSFFSRTNVLKFGDELLAHGCRCCWVKFRLVALIG